MNLPKWVKCELCDWDSHEFKDILCGDCVLQNKDSQFCGWQNEKIQDEIHNIFKECGLTEMNNDVIANELIIRGYLL